MNEEQILSLKAFSEGYQECSDSKIGIRKIRSDLNYMEEAITSLMMREINCDDYDGILTLSRNFGVTKEMLLFHESHARNNQVVLSENIYKNIIAVIFSMYEEHDDCKKAFDEYYSTKYKKVKDKLEKVLFTPYGSTYELKKSFVETFNSFRDVCENAYAFYYVIKNYNGEKSICKNIIEKVLSDAVSEYEEKYRNPYIGDVYYDDDSHEKVFGSHHFERYKQRSLKRIAEALSIKENELDDYIHEYYKSSLSCIPASALMGLLCDKGGDILWITEIIGSSSSCRGYKPDLSVIYDEYYKARIRRYSLSTPNGLVSKFDLSRHCFAEDPMEELQDILHMYSYDVLIEMVHLCNENCYGYVLGNGENDKRSETIIANLRNSVKEKDEIIKLLRNSDIKKQENPVVERKIEYIRDDEKITELKNEIKKLEAENAGLQNRIRSQNNMIAALQNNNGDSGVSDDKEYDLDFLKSKKYMFVGYVERFYSGLKAMFPGSIYIEKSTAALTNIKVDAVVYLTKLLDHCLLEKVESYMKYKDVRSIYCNQSNMDALLSNMYKSLQKEESK